MKSKHLIQRESAAFGAQIVSATQSDRPGDGAHPARLVGMESLIGPHIELAEKLGHLMVQKPFKHSGEITHGGIAQGTFDPCHIQRPPLLHLFADQVEDRFGLAARGLLDREGFFLLL